MFGAVCAMSGCGCIVVPFRNAGCGPLRSRCLRASSLWSEAKYASGQMAKRPLFRAVRRFSHRQSYGGIGLRRTPACSRSAFAAIGRMEHRCFAMRSILPLRLPHCIKPHGSFLPVFTVRRKSSPIVRPLKPICILRVSGPHVRPHLPTGLRCGWKLCRSSACSLSPRDARADAVWINWLGGCRRCRWIKQHPACPRISP